MVGQTLGHYRILEKLGEGGMGEVYRAEDTTLDREVALKTLPVQMSSDPDRLTRFAREAKTLAALDHPNIVTIYSVEQDESIHFLTMQLVQGQPLSKSIPPGGMRLDKFFKLAIPLADALATAHDNGVIHRDLKPANIMITDEGRVKVLDFGLAKLRGEAEPTDLTEVVTEPLTREGQIVGTVPYMSPESLERGAADARSDIFSLGIILYEMATGQRPFQGDSSISIISAIVKDSPEDIDLVRTELPHHLGRIVRHCLEKNPKDRFQTARDVRNELRDLKQESEADRRVGPVKPPMGWPEKQRARWLATTALLVLVGAMVVWQVARMFSAPEDRNDRSVDQPRIVILPFENLGNPEDEYFADGITEEITSRLSAVPGLKVISRTTAMHYKASRPSLMEIGLELDVDYALEGSVRWARHSDQPSRVRITPQLIRVSDDTHLWSGSYDRVVDDVFAIQSHLAQQVLAEMNVAVPVSAIRAVKSEPTESLDAYKAYLEGMHLLRQPHFTLKGWNQALAILERAVELDPDFALAWAELARAHSRLIYFRVDASEERRAKADHAIERAVAKGPGAPEVRLAAGYYHLWALRDAERARKELELALKEMPNSTEAREGLGEVARLQGRVDDAIVHFRQAAQLSPLDPSPVVEMALSLWWARRYEEATQMSERAIVLAPNGVWPYITKAINQWSWKGGTPEARAALAAISNEHPWLPWLWYWQEMYEGRYREAIRHLGSDPGDWITLKWCVRPKSLLESYALELLQEPELARAATEKAAVLLEEKLQVHPDEPRYHSSLGIALAKLGRVDEAVREGKRGVDLFPLSADAIYAQPHVQDLAHISLLVGDYSSACEQLGLLLSIPGLYSIPLVDTDPRWAPLKNQPCYRDLVELYGGSL